MTTKSKNNIINSMIATTIAELITLPICTIKTNHQNNINISKTHTDVIIHNCSEVKALIRIFQYKNTSIPIFYTIKNIYNNGGIKAFYKASFPAITSQVFSTSSKYFLYRYLDDINYQYSNKILNGMISGIIKSFFTHPIDFLKIYWQKYTWHRPLCLPL